MVLITWVFQVLLAGGRTRTVHHVIVENEFETFSEALAFERASALKEIDISLELSRAFGVPPHHVVRLSDAEARRVIGDAARQAESQKGGFTALFEKAMMN